MLTKKTSYQCVIAFFLINTAAVAIVTAAMENKAEARDNDWSHGRSHVEHRHDRHDNNRWLRDHDWKHWRSGHWYQGRHEHREGWWWIVGDAWYFYPFPVYPYPEPYRPPVIVTVPPQATPTTGQYWYYCLNPAGYYPYIPECKTEWQPVPAVPSTVSPQR